MTCPKTPALYAAGEILFLETKLPRLMACSLNLAKLPGLAFAVGYRAI
jgi:hypothetical protein